MAANAVTRETASELGAGFVDTVRLLCVSGRCPLVVDRTMTFMDYSHVSMAWAQALAEEFGRLYDRALAQRVHQPAHDAGDAVGRAGSR
jgi:hypothetical protein